MNRRGFLGLSALSLLSGCMNIQNSVLPSKKSFGVQLWTVNKELHENFAASIKEISNIGFDYVETAGFIGKPATEFRKIVEDTGMKVKACHWGMGDLLANQQKCIDETSAIGAEYLICGHPKPLAPLEPNVDWVLAMQHAMTLEALLKATDGLVTISEGMKNSPLKLAYHNHHFEFIKHEYNGEMVSGMELFTKAISTKDLRLELDIGWLAVGGNDPITYLDKYKDRIDLTHLKDIIADKNAPVGYNSTEVGNGLLDWPRIMAKTQEIGVKYNIIEQEGPYIKPVYGSLSESLAFLRK